MSIFKFISKYLTFIIAILLCTSCSSDKTGGKEEGIIEFDTKAIDEQHPLYGLAPSSATLKYKKEKINLKPIVF